MFQARRGSIYATVVTGGNIRLSTEHSGGRGLVRVLDEKANIVEVVIDRADLSDAISALQAVERFGCPGNSAATPLDSIHGDLKAVKDAVGRLEAHGQANQGAHATMEPMNCTAHWDGRRMTLWSPTQFPDWSAYDELVKTLTNEMNGLGLPGTSVERFGLVPAIKAALSHIKTARSDLAAEREAARSDIEHLRKMVFANDRVLFDGRPDRTRSCSVCHSGVVSDPYCLAPLDAAVSGAPVTSVMAVVVGSADIFEATREALEIADRARRPVAFDFRSITVSIGPGGDPEAVARAWWQQNHGCTPEQSAERR